MLKKLALVCVLFVLCMILPGGVRADLGLDGTEVATGSASVALPITDLQLTGTSVDPVPVKLLVTSGTLAMSTTTGLTFDGASSGSTIYFSGSVANINAALATLTYTRGSTGTDTLEVTLVPRGEVFFTDNGHLYKFISGSITANNARTAAANLTAYGSTGYLATITSAAENSFVAARLQGDGWMSASDASTENDWKWTAGPEAGTSFWSGRGDGSTVGGNYANWTSGEPNDWGTGEDCAQFYVSTGKWNDLPCTGTTLSGYVAEFGAPGDLPTVVAKNISLYTLNAPTVNTFSPADNATGIALDANLVLTFSRAVTVNTGNILLKKTSDNSTVETIDVTSGKVTGSGSDTITINPATTLDESTGYYLTIPNTAFRDGSSIAYAGISNATTWNFTTGDFTDPTISDVASTSITNTAVTITWTTDESASSRLQYGVTSAYGTTTAETNTSPRVTSHSYSLSSLLPCTLYHYRVISRDAATNSTTSDDGTFLTTGCAADETPARSNTTSITSSSGGSTNLTQDNKKLTVTSPSNFTDDAASVVIQIKAIAGAPVLQSLGRPTQLPREVSDIVFDVKAIINGTTELDTFDAPVTIEYQYTDADVAGLDESSLWLYHYHNSAWTALDNCTVNTSTNTISCTTMGFSIFGLFGNTASSGTHSSSSSGTHSSSSSGSSKSTEECRQTPPGSKAPWLYSATPQGATTAMLYFTRADDPFDHYALEYGLQPGQYTYGSTNIGGQDTRTFLVQSLRPYTTYYMRVRAFNGCAAGPWSNEITVRSGQLAGVKKLGIVGSELTPEPSPSTENSEAVGESEASADGYTLNVKVFDTEDKPIAGATVTLPETNHQVVTNADGIARFTAVEPGHYQVKIAHNGYQGEQSLELSGDAKEYSLRIVVEQQDVVFSNWAIGVIGGLVLIISLLLWLLLRRRQKKE